MANLITGASISLLLLGDGEGVNALIDTVAYYYTGIAALVFLWAARGGGIADARAFDPPPPSLALRKDRKQRRQRNRLSRAESRGGLAAAAAVDTARPNFTGRWNVVKQEGYGDFLELQGVGFVMRKAADKAKCMHVVEHSGNSFFLRTESLINREQTFEIGGPPQTSEIRGRVFEDSMDWSTTGEPGVLVVTKLNRKEGITLTIERRMVEGCIHITSKALKGEKLATATQVCERIGG